MKILVLGSGGVSDMRSSMRHDLPAGRRLEAPWPWPCGGAARIAADQGLPWPVNRTVYAALKPRVDGAGGSWGTGP